MHRLVYYLDAVGYGGAVNYVERLVARIDPSELAVTIVHPDTPAFAPFRDVLAPYSVRWVGMDPPHSLKSVAYRAGSHARRVVVPTTRRVHGGGTRSAAKLMLGILGLAEEVHHLRIVRGIVRAVQPDLLHVNLDRFPDVTGKLAMLVGREAGASAVLATLHRPPQSPVSPSWVHHFFDRRALRAVDRTIVVAPSQGRQLVGWYGAPERQVQVIPNGAAPACFDQRASHLNRAELGFEPTDFLIVHLGSILPFRGQLVLATALDRVRQSCPHLRAAFVGDVVDTAYASSLDQLLSAQVARPFRRFGYRSDATEVLRLADVAVISSFEEGHSFALLEAMALGRAIVATGIESNAESLGQGEAGLLVPPGDSEAMAVAIRRLHDDRDLRVRLGAAARARAELLYTEERMIHSTFDLYRHILSRES